MLYFAVLTLTANELGPRTPTELVFLFVCLVALFLFNGVFFGSVVNIMQ